MTEPISTITMPVPKKNLAPFIAMGTVLILVLLYLGLCLFVHLSPAIFKGVSVGTLALDGMDRQEAQTALTAEIQTITSTLSMPIGYGNITDELSGSILHLSGFVTVESAYRVGRTNFFLGGANYLKHLLGATTAIPLSMDYTPEGEAEVNTILNQFQSRIDVVAINSSWEVVEDTLILTKGRHGVTIQRDENSLFFKEELSRHIAHRLSNSNATTEIEFTQLLVNDTTTPELDITAISNSVAIKPVDAYLNSETGAIVPEEFGLHFDIDYATSRFRLLEEMDSVSISVTSASPEITTENLITTLFPDILGEAETPVYGSSNRRHNVSLSGEACDNFIVMPNQIWSYNTTTGSRTTQAGYRDAPIYLKGESVQDIGGGVCQTSSTIYYALLHTQLEIVERHNHLYSTGYVPDGMDATVFFGSLDFRMSNNTAYPILIDTDIVTRDGKTYQTVVIHGTKTSDITVDPFSKVYNYTSKDTVYKPDGSIAVGTTKKSQSAYKGRSSTLYLNYYDKDGTLIETETMYEDTYRPRGATILYNPLDAVSLGLAEPTVPTVPPVEPTVPPVEPPVTPTVPPVEPTVPPVEPTVPPVEPTVPPVEPTVPPVEPTVPPVEPTVPPVEPTVPPVTPTTDQNGLPSGG